MNDTHAFMEDAIEGLFDHGAGEFIVSVHLAEDGDGGERGAARRASRPKSPPCSWRALNRFLHSRLKRRQVRRSVYQAMKFVAYDG